MTDDADFPGFKPINEQWRVEYGRIRKLGGGDYWTGCDLETAARSKLSPYALGLADHRSMREATEVGDRNGCSLSVDYAVAGRRTGIGGILAHERKAVCKATIETRGCGCEKIG